MGSSCDGTPNVDKDTLYLGYTANGDDRDYFRLDVPEAGTQVTVRLSHLGLDDDLVVFGPVPPPLRDAEALDVRAPGGGRPARPAAAHPGGHPGGARRRAGDGAPDGPGIGVLGVSDNRGLADEEVTFIVPEDADG